MRRSICLLALLAACSPNPARAGTPTPVAAVEEAPCHVPIKVRKEATRFVLVDCGGNETELKFSEITGPAGDKGETGARGGQGPAGTDGDKTMKWCHHDETTHRNNTVTLKMSEILARYGGYKGAQDLPGACGETENVCVCDAPICQNQQPQVTHYFGDPSYD